MEALICSNALLAPERKGRAGKSGGFISSLSGACPFRPVKQGVRREQKEKAVPAERSALSVLQEEKNMEFAKFESVSIRNHVLKMETLL
ncbi:MAG: hypothetical protein FJ130_11860 [Deltaproteobacteria bacterium]|nr:hypothetical protein [Deltaproteobacteria bacterium]